MVAGMGLAYGLSKLPWFQERPLGCILLGSATTLVGLISAKCMSPIEASYEKDGKLVRNTKNKPLRLALYTLGSLGLGITVVPLVHELNLASPEVIPSAMAVTGALMGGASLVAYSLPKHKMFAYRHTLQSALLGLLGLELAGIIVGLIWGNTSFVRALNTTDNFLGIAVFIGYMMYDTHAAIQNYEQGYADHLGMSI
jgi:FtsH-binding integral membrane protein